MVKAEIAVPEASRNGFVPAGDKLHTMQPQRPGLFIAVTEGGVIFEVAVIMETQKVMARQWEVLPWDNEAVKTEIERVAAEVGRMQMTQQGGPQRPAHPGVIRPTTARPGTI